MKERLIAKTSDADTLNIMNESEGMTTLVDVNTGNAGAKLQFQSKVQTHRANTLRTCSNAESNPQGMEYSGWNTTNA